MASTKAELEGARRVRAGVIGLLACCRCTYPVDQHETETGHARECPAHGMTMSARATGAQDAYLQLGFDLDTPLDVLSSTAGADACRRGGDVVAGADTCAAGELLEQAPSPAGPARRPTQAPPPAGALELARRERLRSTEDGR